MLPWGPSSLRCPMTHLDSDIIHSFILIIMYIYQYNTPLPWHGCCLTPPHVTVRAQQSSLSHDSPWGDEWTWPSAVPWLTLRGWVNMTFSCPMTHLEGMSEHDLQLSHDSPWGDEWTWPSAVPWLTLRGWVNMTFSCPMTHLEGMSEHDLQLSHDSPWGDEWTWPSAVPWLTLRGWVNMTFSCPMTHLEGMSEHDLQLSHDSPWGDEWTWPSAVAAKSPAAPVPTHWKQSH